MSIVLPDVDVLQLGDSAVPVGDGDTLHLTVHVVLGLDQLATVDLPSGGLHSHDVTLGLVEDFNRDSDNRHFFSETVQAYSKTLQLNYD